MSANNSSRLALVAGAGPGLGLSLLKTLDEAGYKVIGLGRSIPTAASDFTYKQLDLSGVNATAQIVDELVANYGEPEVVIHNAAKLVINPFEQLSPDDFIAPWQSMVLSAYSLAKAVLPYMAKRGKGSFLVSGATASIRGGKNFAAFASAKFALRGLTQSLAREYQPKGVHIAHILLDGIIDTTRSRELHSLVPEKMLNPGDVAQAYLQIAQQPKSAWSHEIDLRPMTEAF